jgi:putative hydrolase of the HAD superfamily
MGDGARNHPGKDHMHQPKAIGFDLFNTLMTVHPDAMQEAHQRQLRVLREERIDVEAEAFGKAYVEAAVKFLKAAHKEGKETHNSLWVVDALAGLGHNLSPEDPRIAKAVDAYFTAFYSNSELIPGTADLLGALAERYPLAMLTNFTHGPAVREIIDLLGLNPFFQEVLVSGELGYRKPHPYVFERLVEALGVPADRILFVGDDLEADVQGARDAGLQPVLTTCVRDGNLPAARTPLSPADPVFPEDVPRISCWQDLLDLLEA